MLRVVLADDQPLYLDAMRREVADDGSFEVVEAVTTGAACVAAYDRHRPDVVAVSSELADVCGLDVLVRIRATDPGARVCLLGCRPDVTQVLEGARAGAAGHLDKQVLDGAELRRHLRSAAEGGEAYDNRTLATMLRGLRESTPVRSAPTPDLTARQLEVLRLIAAGSSNTEIAREMHVSVNTVKTYVRGLFGRLDVTDRAEAVGRAYELGLLRSHGTAAGSLHRAG